MAAVIDMLIHVKIMKVDIDQGKEIDTRDKRMWQNGGKGKKKVDNR